MIRLLSLAAAVAVTVAPPSVDNSPFGAPGNPEPPPFQPQPEDETTTAEPTTVASEPPEETTETATAEPLAPADVAFLIDISGSMLKYNNMDVVKSAVTALLNDLRSDGVPIRNMVLSPFYDYAPRDEESIELFVSDDVDEFITHLYELQIAWGANDCFGASLSGMRNTLPVVGKRSFVFVFGDGPPSDEILKEEIVESLNAQEIMLHYFRFNNYCTVIDEDEARFNELMVETHDARLTFVTEPLNVTMSEEVAYITAHWPVIGQDTSVLVSTGSGSSSEEVSLEEVSDKVKKNIIRKLILKLKSTMKHETIYGGQYWKQFGKILSAVRRTFGLMKLKTLEGEANSVLVDSYAVLDVIPKYTSSNLKFPSHTVATAAFEAATSLRKLAKSLAELSLTAGDYTSGIEARYSRLLERKRVVRIGDLGKVLSGCLEVVAIDVEGTITGTHTRAAFEKTIAEIEQLM